jgi:alpha-D-ribose 1-methylphosphonate 5-triphosphate synthase subunit PhnH
VNAIDLCQIGPGFVDPALGSQALFRAILEALAHPGRIVAVSAEAATPPDVHAAAALALLALLDQDCALWLSPTLARTPAAAWLRFHTGCCLVDRPAQAQFAWIANPDELPGLGDFAEGSECEPEKSTTCLLQVDGLENGRGWRLEGPGIHGACRLAVAGVGDEFVAQWHDNHARFPRGIDLLFSAGKRLAGLSRTTRIES